MTKTIPIRCKGNRTLPHGKLKHFQGGLKEMSEESAGNLRALILKHGWVAPIFVWNKNQILDGHGRLLVLGQLLKRGYKIGPLPIVDIQAKSRKEAAEILLAINSKFQSITSEGLYGFLHEFELELDELPHLELPDIDLDAFKAGYLNENGAEKGEAGGGEQDKITCPKCGHRFEE